MQTNILQMPGLPHAEPLPRMEGYSKNEAPHESSFLAMLNSFKSEEAPAPKAEVSVQREAAPSNEERGAAKKEDSLSKKAVDAAESEDGRVSEKKEVAKKDEATSSTDSFKEKAEAKKGKNVDPLLASVANAAQNADGKNATVKNDGKARVEKSGGAKTAKKQAPKTAALKQAENKSEKIDVRQLDFLNKIANAKEEGAGQAAELSSAALLADASGFGNAADQDALVSNEGLSLQGANLVKGAATESLKELQGSKTSKITVRDLRTKIRGAGKASTENGAKDISQKFQVGKNDAKKNFVTSVRQDAQGNIEMTLDLNAQAQKNILALDSQSAGADGSTFQAMLKNQVTQNAGDIVKAGNIILRDGDQGQINLILHPESLGNVKISLDMNGKVVQGHIIVQSREAMNAFNESADALRNAFIQSGFEDANFDVSYSQSQMNFAQGQNGEGAQEEAARQGRKIYSDFVQESLTSVEGLSDNYNSASDYEVNLIA